MTPLRDDDLSFVKTFQLDALDRMQTDPYMYVWRIVEQVTFLSSRGQRWTRRVSLRIPDLPDIPPHRDRAQSENDYYAVSLGAFRRRRFADFSVTTDDGSECHLLTRRQHGYCLATCLMRQLFFTSPVGDRLDRTALLDLHKYVAEMITTMTKSEYTAQRAGELLDRLFDASGIIDSAAHSAAHEFLRKHCISSSDQTQYLCWVKAQPGQVVNLRATYTQSDVARFFPETDAAKSNWRLKWRNWRTSEYARYNVLPLHYSFDTPAYRDCKSYYFTIDAPEDTRITLLDWVSGRRFRTIARHPRANAAVGDEVHPSPPDADAGELDCAEFSYHFYNRRNIRDRRSEMRPQPKERRISRGRRISDDSLGTRLHAFVRAEPIENSQLAAIGWLSLTLAVLAGLGALVPSPGSNTHGTNFAQWLLLAPAALTLFVAQQRRHHYARLTRRYRLLLWLYIVLAMFFAGSIAFDVTSVPLLSTGLVENAPRLISGIFAIASIVLIVVAGWSGRICEAGARRRCEKVIRRVEIFGTPAARRVAMAYWRRPRAWLCAKRPSDYRTLRRRRETYPSYRSYLATARHGADRMLGTVAVLVAGSALLMVFWPWGLPEECAMGRSRAQQVATESGKSTGVGRCADGRWVAAGEAKRAHSHSAGGRRHRHPGRPVLAARPGGSRSIVVGTLLPGVGGS